MEFNSKQITNQSLMLESIDSETFEDILDFVYQRRCRISRNNIFDILVAADMLGLTRLMAFINIHFNLTLNCKNCLQLLNFTLMRNFEDLSLKAMNHIFKYRHFIESSKKQPNWNHNLLKKLLTAEHIRFVERSIIIKYFRYWSVVNQKRRDLLAQVVDEIEINEKCKPSILDLLNDLKTLYENKRSEIKTRFNLFAVGGYRGSESYAPGLVSLNEYHSHVSKGFSASKCLPNMIYVRTNFGSAKDKNGFYLIGGKGKSESALSSVEYYDCDENKWYHKTTLNENRMFCAATSWNSLIYVSGGSTDGMDVLRSVCVYVPRKNIWKYIADMNQYRRGHQMCCVNGMIYAMGGDDGSKVTASVEAYDTFADTWKKVSCMNIARKRFGAGAVGQFIFVFGGLTNDGKSVDEVEKYDTVTNTWSLLYKFRGFYDMSVAVYEHYIYLCGGYINNHAFCDIVAFHADSHVTRLISQLKMARAGLAAFVMPEHYWT